MNIENISIIAKKFTERCGYIHARKWKQVVHEKLCEGRLSPLGMSPNYKTLPWGLITEITLVVKLDYFQELLLFLKHK